MKQKILRLAFAAAALFSAAGASAQMRELGPEWGDNDSIRMENFKTFSFYRESYQFKYYDEAAGYLQYLMDAVPKARPEIYHAGVLIYTTKYNASTDEAQKKIYLDSLLMIFDRWIDNFANDPEQGRAYLTRKKALDYMALAGNDREGVNKLLQEAIAADSTMKYPEVVAIYFQQLTDDYKLFESIEADEYIAEYEKLAGLLDSVDTPESAKQRETIDMLAAGSGALDCGTLETIYGPRIEADPENKDLYTAAIGLLQRNQCKGPFYTKVIEGLHKLDPSASTALILAGAFEDNKEYETAIKYLTDALAGDVDPELKENLYVRLAANYLQSGKAQLAANNAKQAIAVNPESGYGYNMLALAYAAGSSACPEGFERQTVYWLVYDNLAKARKLLADDGRDVKNIDADMASYRENFPLKEETFFRGMDEGSTYTVKCGWITGTTTVRTVK